MSDDIQILRELAKQYREIAEDPAQAVKRERYRAFNDLKPVGPMVLIEPDSDGAWREIIPRNSLLVCDPYLREYEFLLRRMIYHATNFHDDQVFEPYVTLEIAGDYTGYHYGNPAQKTAWGLNIRPKTAREDGGAYSLENFLATDEDYDILLNHRLDFIIDHSKTEQRVQRLNYALDGILGLKLRLPYSVLVCSLLIEIVHLRDMTSLMMDLYDQPDRFHSVMRHMSGEKEALLKRLERDGQLVMNNDNVYTGSGGTGYSARLPAPGFNGSRVRLKDIWGFADAQEFALVSNEMFREFVLPYQQKPLSLFGLACYGCCEKVDQKLDDILAIPNIWRISVSPWSDIRLASEKIMRKAVYSRKPNPALVSMGADEAAIRADIQSVLDVTGGCNVEFILKDLRTCNNNPDNLTTWVNIAKSMCS